MSSFAAGAPIARGIAVTLGPDRSTVIPATANSRNLGIATDDQDTVGRSIPVADEPGEIVLGRVGAPVPLDALLTSDATGRLVSARHGEQCTAIAWQPATAADQLIRVALTVPGLVAP